MLRGCWMRSLRGCGRGLRAIDAPSVSTKIGELEGWIFFLSKPVRSLLCGVLESIYQIPVFQRKDTDNGADLQLIVWS